MIFFDFEVFKKDWLVVFRFINTTDHIVIVNDADKLEEFYNENKHKIFVGFNNIHYDNFIFAGILAGLNPKMMSDDIIESNKKPWYILKRYPLYSMDLTQDLAWVNLKEIEGYLGMNIEETPVDFNKPEKLTTEELEIVIKYCKHDVDAAYKLAEERVNYLMGKLYIIQMFNVSLDYCKYSNQGLTARILKANKYICYDEFTYDAPKELRIMENRDVYNFYTTKDIDYKDKLKRRLYDIDFIFAYGGLHAAIPNYIREDCVLWNVDVSSFYPSMMIKYDYITRSLDDIKIFAELTKQRLMYKATGVKQKAAALKQFLVTFSGAMKSSSSMLYDPHMNNQVCISGQLFLLDLCEHISKYCRIIQANTDGILIEPFNEEKCADVCKAWEDRTGFELERDVFVRLYQKDVNNYIAVTDKGKIKVKGSYVRQYDEDNLRNCNIIRRNMSIVDVAIVKYFANGIKPELTINECTDINKFAIIIKRGGTYYDTIHRTTHGDISLQKVNRVYASNDVNLGKLLRLKHVKDGSIREDTVGNLPEHCVVDNAATLDISQINKQWYIDLCYSRIDDFKNSEEVTVNEDF